MYSLMLWRACRRPTWSTVDEAGCTGWRAAHEHVKFMVEHFYGDLVGMSHTTCVCVCVCVCACACVLTPPPLCSLLLILFLFFWYPCNVSYVNVFFPKYACIQGFSLLLRIAFHVHIHRLQSTVRVHIQFGLSAESIRRALLGETHAKHKRNTTTHTDP